MGSEGRAGRMSLGVECDWVNFAISTGNGQYTSNSIVRCVCFDSDRSIWDEVSQDWHSSKGFFEGIKGLVTGFREIPRGIFSGYPGEGDHNIRVVKNKTVVEVCEAQE